jgi:hypothetical protein
VCGGGGPTQKSNMNSRKQTTKINQKKIEKKKLAKKQNDMYDSLILESSILALVA